MYSCLHGTSLSASLNGCIFLGDRDAVDTIKAHPDLSDPPSTIMSMGPSIFPLSVQLLLFSDLPDQSHLSTSIHPFLIRNTSVTEPLYRQTHPYNIWRGAGRGWCHWAGRKVLAETSSLMGDRSENLREIHQQSPLHRAREKWPKVDDVSAVC